MEGCLLLIEHEHGGYTGPGRREVEALGRL